MHSSPDDGAQRLIRRRQWAAWAKAYLDDLALLPIGIWLALRLVPADVGMDCRAQAAQNSPDVGPSRAGAAVITAIWVASLAGAIVWPGALFRGLHA